ncbi:uncharacterized protein LOC108269550 isoform X1 [Tachysurus ichikawai]
MCHCYDRGVFHCDIKAENLINPDTLEVKLIDFGCGALLKDTTYKYYFGTDSYAPLEWLISGEYMAIPATVWSLGILLFYLLSGECPFVTKFDCYRISGNKPGLVSRGIVLCEVKHHIFILKPKIS